MLLKTSRIRRQISFREFEVAKVLHTDEGTLERWLTLMELNYLAENPYHNSTHAADVLAVSLRIR